MNKEELVMLFQYNAWSTARILGAAGQVSADQFLAPVPFPHGSLRGTLIHTLFGEWVWRKRWEGNPQNPGWKADEFPTFATLQARWANEEERLMKFVSSLTEERMRGKFHYVSTEGEPHERAVWESMLHLVNHGTQHKTEAAAILTGFGHSPGDIDLIVYLNQGR
jgi:uncharacterized damage-inducible protein DinB